jgi:hypothetical protein
VLWPGPRRDATACRLRASPTFRPGPLTCIKAIPNLSISLGGLGSERRQGESHAANVSAILAV